MYDVVFIADIYVPGGTNFQLARNIRHLAAAGRRIGIVPVQLPHARGRKAINRFVREAVSERLCEIVDPALSIVRTGHLFVDNPRLMAPDLALKTRIAAGRIVMLVPFPPQDGDGAMTFDPGQVLATLHRVAEGAVVWAPVANLVRDQLRRFYPDLPLTESNAHPIVEASAYTFSAEINDRKRILIGRHSRPEADKWPATRNQFLKIYPGVKPFEVSLLGIDAASLSGLIGRLPENYRVLPYDSMRVPEFLGGIDFFVYYHHRRWVEAFGIATAEAMAAGVPCVLPAYMETNFADAAIYATPNDVRDAVARLHRNPRKYRELARHGRNFVRRNFSAARFGGFADELGIVAAPPRPAIARRRKYDAVYLSDYASPKVFSHALLDELAVAADGGGKVAARDVHPEMSSRIHAATDAFTARGITLLEPGEPVVCGELVLNDPWRAVSNGVDLGRFQADHTTCVVSYPHGDLAGIQRYLAPYPQFQAGRLSWAPRDSYARLWLEAFDPNLPLTAANRPVAVSTGAVARLKELRAQRPITVRRTVGFAGVENDDDAHWITHILPVLAGEPAPVLTCFGEQPAARLDPRIVSSGYRGIDLIKWVAKLDRLVILRDRLKADNLDYMVALCRAAGIPVLYRWRNNKERAAGSRTLEGVDKAELKKLLIGDAALIEAAATPAAEEGATLNGHAHLNGHAPKLNGLKLNGTGKPALDGTPTLNGKSLNGKSLNGMHGKKKGTLLFVSQNGTGVGHVVRLLSIARRLADRYDCLFLSMSQAVAFIAAFGFHVEYFPSAVYSGVSYTDWIHWLRHKVDLMIDAWDVKAVVFDGNVPYAAVAEAAAARPNVSSAWIRRGMWPDSEEDRRRLRSATYFDLVIEPRDFAEELDEGPTRPLRDTVRLVPPIQLLGEDEMLPRAEACATLGMDPAATNVLVQLGSGNNRDTQTIIARIVTALGDTPNVEIYNLRWPISDVPPIPLPHVKDLAVFPIARFYAAFDFSVAAAGYNTAHEVLGHRLPTIFVPNTTEGMDNQRGRADFSAARGLSLSATPATIAGSIEQMMDEDFRHGLRRRLRRLSLENGAHDAAAIIDQLAYGSA